MKIKREDLVRALSLVDCGLAGCSGANASAFNCYRFVPGRIYTFNNDIAASVSLDHELDCAVPAYELKALVQKAKTEMMSLQITGNELVIQAGKFKAGLALREEFNLPPGMSAKESDLIALPEDFVTAVQACLPCVYKSANKSDLNTLHVTTRYVEACDSHRIARYAFTKGKGPGEMLFPLNVAKELARHTLVKGLSHEDGMVLMDDNGVMLYAKTMDINYPSLNKHFNVEGDEIEFPKELLDVMGRAQVFCDEEYPIAYVRLSNDEVEVGTRSAVGHFYESCEIDYKGESAVFGVYPSLLVEVLGQNRKAVMDEGRMEFKSGPLTHVCALLQCPDEEKAVYFKK